MSHGVLRTGPTLFSQPIKPHPLKPPARTRNRAILAGLYGFVNPLIRYRPGSGGVSSGRRRERQHRKDAVERDRCTLRELRPRGILDWKAEVLGRWQVAPLWPTTIP